MLEQAELTAQFEQLLAQQRQAAGAYAALADQVTDPTVKDQVRQLCRDKQRHVELTERLLEIVE
jgi:rubrerythrin